MVGLPNVRSFVGHRGNSMWTRGRGSMGQEPKRAGVTPSEGDHREAQEDAQDDAGQGYEDYADGKALVDNATMMKNRLANRGGFSSIQRAFGFYPRLRRGLQSH